MDQIGKDLIEEDWKVLSRKYEWIGKDLFGNNWIEKNWIGRNWIGKEKIRKGWI